MADIENIDDHLAWTCNCGCVRFNLLKSGKIECNNCGTTMTAKEYKEIKKGGTMGDAIKIMNMKVIVQENGIIRDETGWLIGRLVDDCRFQDLTPQAEQGDSCDKDAALSRALRALCLTRDYVGQHFLPAVQGWEWFDAGNMIAEIIPDDVWTEQFKLRTQSTMITMRDEDRKTEGGPE